MTGPPSANRRDGFDETLGEGRGLSDPTALRERLAQTDRQLDEALRDSRVLLARVDERAQAAEALAVGLRRAEVERDAALLEVDALRHSLDTARYAAMHAGAPDPATSADAHHGTFTPGRPYLEGQHVLHPETGACFRAKVGGVMPGGLPGVDPGWERCDGGGCPDVPAELPLDPHPVESGHAMRQTTQTAYWWDAACKRWALADLSGEHLLAVIDWLLDHLDWLYDHERRAGLRFPCPPNAYQSPEDWLRDTPLMAALLAEKHRRGLTSSGPPVAPGPWRWGSPHLPF